MSATLSDMPTDALASPGAAGTCLVYLLPAKDGSTYMFNPAQYYDSVSQGNDLLEELLWVQWDSQHSMPRDNPTLWASICQAVEVQLKHPLSREPLQVQLDEPALYATLRADHQNEWVVRGGLDASRTD